MISMKQTKPIPTTWVGYYAHDPTEDYEFDLPVVTFKMAWKFGWLGRFSGTVYDGPNSEMPETGEVKGVVRKSDIRFTKYMPMETLIDFDGHTIRTKRPHPPIEY